LEAQKSSRPQAWHVKQTDDKGKPSTNIDMVFILPIEFRAPSKYEQEESDEEGLEEVVAQLTLQSQQDIFDKPTHHWHLKPLYIKGFVNGKPMVKMLVDGGAAVNLMPYTMLRKLGKGPKDLLETNMMLKDFGGNASKTRGAVNIELTIGSKTLPTTFFVNNGKGTYSLLLGHDWIHANCCIPSTMNQCLNKWQRDNVEVVQVGTYVSVAIADLVY